MDPYCWKFVCWHCDKQEKGKSFDDVLTKWTQPHGNRRDMVTLLAFTVQDGWAIVEDAGSLWLTKGQYLLEQRQAVTEAEATKMMLDEAMDPADEEFPDWDIMATTLTARRLQSAGPNIKAEVQAACQRLLGRNRP